MNDRVSVTITDGVADVRMVRVDKMNALDNAMFEAGDRSMSPAMMTIVRNRATIANSAERVKLFKM